jgi:hypothetical protein
MPKHRAPTSFCSSLIGHGAARKGGCSQAPDTTVDDGPWVSCLPLNSQATRHRVRSVLSEWNSDDGYRAAKPAV